jgi:hypothetical protein
LFSPHISFFVLLIMSTCTSMCPVIYLLDPQGPKQGLFPVVFVWNVLSYSFHFSGQVVLCLLLSYWLCNPCSELTLFHTVLAKVLPLCEWFIYLKLLPHAQFTYHPADGGSKVLRNINKLLPDYMALQPRRWLSLSEKSFSAKNSTPVI